MGFAVVNGKVFDERQNKVETRNLMIQKNRVSGVGYIPDEDEESLEIIDAKKGLLIPNTADFFMTPYPKNIPEVVNKINNKGVLHVTLLPNENEVPLETPEEITAIKNIMMDHQTNNVAIAASALTNDFKLSELSLMIKAGASAIYFSRIVEDQELFRQALIYVDMIGCPIIFGPLTKMVKHQAHLNSGKTSFEIGIKGESEHVEVLAIKSCLDMIEKYCSVPVHFCAVSSAIGVLLINKFKSTYRNTVTVGVSPVHCLISDDYLNTYNSKLKCNPPLRSKETVEKLMILLEEGAIDHLPSLHNHIIQDTFPKPFHHQSFGIQTLDHYINLAIHCLITASIKLDSYESILACPKSLNFFDHNKLELNSKATFIVVDASKNQSTQDMLFDSVPIERFGGLISSINNGVVAA